MLLLPPKILFASQGLNHDGGIASVSRTIACAFDEGIVSGRIDRVDHLLVNECPSQPPRPPARGVQYIQNGGKVRFFYQLWRLQRRYRHDLFVFDHVGVARIMTLPKFGMLPNPYAVFVHGTEIELAAEGNRFYNALLGANRIIANSQYTAKRVCRILPSVKKHVCVVPLCIEPARLETWGKAPEYSSSVSKKRVVIIVARMCAQERGKGHDELIEAWPQVKRRVSDAQLWIVGDGDDRPRYEAKVEECCLTESVKFFGRVDVETLGKLYRLASIFAMPSCQEGFGIAYAEAMWHALPCIASRSDAGSEIIEDGSNGFLVRYGDVDAIADKIAVCLENSKLVERMGAIARTYSLQRFSYPRFRKNLFHALGC